MFPANDDDLSVNNECYLIQCLIPDWLLDKVHAMLWPLTIMKYNTF